MQIDRTKLDWFSVSEAGVENAEFAARYDGRRYVAYGRFDSIDEYAVDHGPTQADVDAISALLDDAYEPQVGVAQI